MRSNFYGPRQLISVESYNNPIGQYRGNFDRDLKVEEARRDYTLTPRYSPTGERGEDIVQCT